MGKDLGTQVTLFLLILKQYHGMLFYHLLRNLVFHKDSIELVYSDFYPEIYK